MLSVLTTHTYHTLQNTLKGHEETGEIMVTSANLMVVMVLQVYAFSHNHQIVHSKCAVYCISLYLNKGV
jgi:hypothetical protein